MRRVVFFRILIITSLLLLQIGFVFSDNNVGDEKDKSDNVKNEKKIKTDDEKKEAELKKEQEKLKKELEKKEAELKKEEEKLEKEKKKKEAKLKKDKEKLKKEQEKKEAKLKKQQEQKEARYKKKQESIKKEKKEKELKASDDKEVKKKKKIKTEKEEVSEKQERIEGLRNKYKITAELIKNLKKELDDINKMIYSLNDVIIKTLDQKQIDGFQEKKNSFLLKKIDIQQKIVELELALNNQKQELKKKKKDNYRSADGTLNWEKTIDISNITKYNKGTWNITVKAQDDMNNYSDEKALNIKIDPRSDIPNLTVINPLKNARVPSNLKIVGTAYDDDGIKKVVMWIDNDKKEIICEGKEFWYYNLDTILMKDGNHQLKFRVFDIKGISSKEYIVPYKLDRKTPSVIIESMISGTTVSGKLDISGKVFDGNGIKTIEYSIDDRITFNRVRNINYSDKNKSNASWSVVVDSERLVEGIQTIWIRAIDETDSQGYEALTIIVDHKKPIVHFQYPRDKEKVDAKFVASGFADDNVEIKNIFLLLKGTGVDNKPEKIKMLPGNPFWRHEVDISKLNNGKYQLIASVEDISGNIETSIVNIELVKEIDKPVVVLKSFEDGDRFSSSLPLFGTVHDDDESKEVVVKIFREGDKKSIYEEKVSSKYSFSKDIDLTNESLFIEGKYIVELTPVDINGIIGDKVSRSFWIDRSYPRFEPKSISNWAGKSFNGKFELGVSVIKHGSLKSIKYSIIDAATNKEIIGLKELKFKNNEKPELFKSEPIKEDFTGGKIKFSDGITLIKLIAEDDAGNNSSIIVPIVIDTKLPIIKTPKIDSSKGMIKDEEFIIDDNLLLENVSVNISSSDKTAKTISEKKLSIGDEREYVLNVKNKEQKFIDYTVELEANDLAGNLTKESFKINFKETKAGSHKITIKISQKDSSVYFTEPKVFVEKENVGIDATDFTIYGFAPFGYEDIRMIYEKKEKKAEVTNNKNGIYIFRFTNEERNKMKVGEIPAKIAATQNQSNIDIKEIILFNDMLDPLGEIIWPPSYIPFNSSITMYGKASDDSGSVTIQYITDENIPKKMKIVDFEKKILSKILNESFKKKIVNLYIKNKEYYKLKDDIKGDELLKVCNILNSINFNLNFKEVEIDKSIQIPKKENVRNFERNILKKVKDQSNKNLLLSFYKKVKKNYILRNDLNREEKLKLVKILISTIDLIKYEVPVIDPLKKEQTLSLQEFINTNNITMRLEDEIFKINFPIDEMNDGEHIIFIKIRDASGRETIKKAVIIADKIKPELDVWQLTPKVVEDKEVLPSKDNKDKNKKTVETKKVLDVKEEERINGKISIRGEAKDNYYLSNIIVIHNEKEIIADGRHFWECLYNLNELKEIDLKSEEAIPHSIQIYAIDLAGNKKIFDKKTLIDYKQDVPIVFINSPAVKNQRFTGLVELAGIALDDDGVEYIQYRIDHGFTSKLLDKAKIIKNEGAWERIDMNKGSVQWNKRLPKEFLSSGKHILEVQAIDMNGLKGEIKSIVFHLDMENPTVKIISPPNGTYIKGDSIITGRALDPNDIDLVEISTNYGWSFVSAEGKNIWRYYFDSKSVPDGPMRALIRTKDQAGSEAFSFALYNIDNTPPEIDVLLPKDGMIINNKYRIVGRAKDNIGIDEVKLFINTRKNDALKNADKEGFVFVQGKEAWYYDIDATNWDPMKTYHLIARVRDLAGNVTERSIDFNVNPISDLPVVEMDQPQPNQHMTGEAIDFFGTARDDEGIESVYIKIDDLEEVKVDGTATWRYFFPTINLKPGIHKVVIYAKEKNKDGTLGKTSGPVIRLFYFDESGPVINIESHINGAPMEHRPWLSGSAYYYEKDLVLKLKRQIQERKHYKLKHKFRRTPEKIPLIEAISVSTFEVQLLKLKHIFENRVKTVYLTLDNGKKYTRHFGILPKWKIRVQTQNLSDGPHMLQLKSVTNNNKEILKYFRVSIDSQIPELIIDNPIENTNVNETITVRGSANDNGSIKEVKVALNRYDKNLRQVPEFVQGIYLWLQALGGPLVSGGVGLSFFDDVVRIEAMFGWGPTRENLKDTGMDPDNINPKSFFDSSWGSGKYSPRFSGFTVGGKLLARIVNVPFEFFWGEDARNFSVSLNVGCVFYWFSGFGGAVNEFNESYYIEKRPLAEEPGYDPAVDGKVLAGFMYQVDFFKVERYGPLRKFALYFEHVFYFIASEIEGGLKMQYGLGIRNAFF